MNPHEGPIGIHCTVLRKRGLSAWLSRPSSAFESRATLGGKSGATGIHCTVLRKRALNARSTQFCLLEQSESYVVNTAWRSRPNYLRARVRVFVHHASVQ
jgi:hypothetical protein